MGRLHEERLPRFLALQRRRLDGPVAAIWDSSSHISRYVKQHAQ
ncbi:hypothetical protein ACWGLF_45090 [Streptomyces puniciscabiei]